MIKITSKLLSLILVQVNLFNELGFVSGSICTGNNASPNWYGAAGYPPYFTRNTPEKCPFIAPYSLLHEKKVDVSRFCLFWDL